MTVLLRARLEVSLTVLAHATSDGCTRGSRAQKQVLEVCTTSLEWLCDHQVLVTANPSVLEQVDNIAMSKD